MKISVNKLKQTPPNLPFNLCVYGKLDETLTDWCNYWGFQTETSGKFTNILIPMDVKLINIFEDHQGFKYLDGFSPNLNKHLHVGHLSNLVLASAFYNLGIAEIPVSILGDTLIGDVNHNDALIEYKTLCEIFNYNVQETFYASEMKYTGDLLVNGIEDYEGTKIFDFGDDKIVGLKSDGSTTYFYQDMALAEKLNDKTLYLTGSEQNNHFKLLTNIYPNIVHLGLGLLTIDRNKMSSRLGNTIMAKDLIDELLESLGDIKLVTNVIAGQILKAKPTSPKNINIKDIYNPKTSAGLYISYTTARLNSAGLKPNNSKYFNNHEVEFAYIKSKTNLSPNILFEAIYDVAKKINTLYITHHISGNIENQKIFQPMLDDLVLGMKLLGLHEVNKV